jgi:hypothetical protein
MPATKTFYAINSNPKREVSPEVGKRQKAEYAVISAFVKTALKAGHTLGVHDGEELVLKYSSSYKAVMGAIMSVDDEYLLVYPVNATSGPRMGLVQLIYGNDGPDVISDYTTNLEPLMGKANEVSERLYDKGNY